MKAVVTTPDQPGKLVVREAPDPGSTPDTVIVRVRASSINRGETSLVPARPNGWAPGQDVAGVVEQSTHDGPAAGTRVVGLADGGAWSELVAVPRERIAPLPENVTYAQAACLPVAGLTALRALRALGDVIGRRVLVTGAAGGVGHLAAQLARDAGAAVTGLSRTAIGLDGVTMVGSLPDEMQFDGIIDAVAGIVMEDALAHVAPNARAVSFSGGEPFRMSLGGVRGNPVSVALLFVYDAPGRFDEDLATLAAFVARGSLIPHVEATYGFDRVNEALEHLGRGSVTGKIVLTR